MGTHSPPAGRGVTRLFGRALTLSLLATVFGGPARAADIIAVLELSGDSFSIELKKLWTDVLRGEAKKQLPDYRVFTRENTEMLLAQQGLDLADCTEDMCEVEIGKRLGARLVLSGGVLQIEDEIVASIKLHDTSSGDLLSAERARGRSSAELEEALIGQVARLFVPVRRRAPGQTWSNLPPGGRAFGAAEAWDAELPQRHVVRFESSPPNAEVRIDDDYLCVTPCARALPEGGHTLTMTLPRYGVVNDAISVSKETTVAHELTPLFGWLSVETEPSGLQLFLDDHSLGPSPISRHELDPGVYSVVVQDPRYHPTGREHFRLGGNEHKSFRLDPTPRMGALQVNATDERGNALSLPVTVDRARVGKTPWAGKLLVGPHEVGIGSQSQSVLIQEAQVAIAETSVQAKLQPRGARWPWLAGAGIAAGVGAYMLLGNESETGSVRVQIDIP